MKKNRLEKIMEIIESRDVETQEELVDYLKEAGFNVTQATVSRDIRVLNISKVPNGKGRQKYAVSDNKPDKAEFQTAEYRYINVLREGFISIAAAQNLVVIKTVSGMAMAVAAALDAKEFPELLGCIAGDDTIMLASRDSKDALELIRKIKKMLDE